MIYGEVLFYIGLNSGPKCSLFFVVKQVRKEGVVVGRRKKDKDKAGKMIDEVGGKDGPSSRNNRLKRLIKRMRREE